MSKEALYGAVENRSDELTDLALWLWDNPELGLAETGAAARLQEILDERGFEVEVGIGGLETAFVARYGDGDPVVGTLGEFDALPALSQRAAAEREPVDRGAPGHGCGHNLFGTGSLGGALALADAIDRGDVTGTVAYFGCPAEETIGGKKYMVRAGAFDDVDAIVSWHPGWYTAASKERSLAIDSIKFAFEGRPSHAAAAPDAGRSALDGVQLMNVGVEFMREHVPDEARIHYSITEAGSPPNVVDGEAVVEYYVRSPERAQVDRLTEWVTKVAEGAALMTETEVERVHRNGTYNVIENATIADAIHENMRELGSIEYTPDEQELAADLHDSLGDVSDALASIPAEARAKAAESAMYSEPIEPFNEGQVGSYSADTGDVSWNVPTGRFTGATWPVGTPPHSWQAVAASGSVGTKAAVYASKVIAATMYDLLADEALLAAAQAEFETDLGDSNYESAVGEVDPYEMAR